jgi:hypothetical protein
VGNSCATASHLLILVAVVTGTMISNTKVHMFAGACGACAGLLTQPQRVPLHFLRHALASVNAHNVSYCTHRVWSNQRDMLSGLRQVARLALRHLVLPCCSRYATGLNST